jgi:hypothetical protein
MTKKYGCCDPILWKHEDGWDVYAREDCHNVGGAWVPKWFDVAMVEDAATKAAAMREIAQGHVLGICIYK